MAKQFCSNCGNPLDLQGHCMVCGALSENTIAHLCAFTYHGKRCPAVGTISSSMKGGNYYCAQHFRYKHDHDKCVEILDDYLKNGVPEKKDWRDVLLEQHMKNA